MFNGHFKPIGSFTDPTVTSIEPNFGPWSVQAVSGKLYVTFAVLAIRMAAWWTCSIPTANC